MDTTSLRNKKEYDDIIMKIWKTILIWGRKYMRDFPWRNTQDPYKILIAEIMLHRTRANQVRQIYETFVQDYPDFRSIVKSGIDNMKSQLHPLGLIWRAEYLYRMAEEIVVRYNGRIPSSKEELMRLPGVGEYIASATLCFGYNLPEPILDTNTVRVIGRIWGIKIDDSSRRNRKFVKIMNDLISHGEPRMFSFSLIDLAFFICKKKNMKCDGCPLKRVCTFPNTEMS